MSESTRVYSGTGVDHAAAMGVAAFAALAMGRIRHPSPSPPRRPQLFADYKPRVAAEKAPKQDQSERRVRHRRENRGRRA